MNRVFDGVYGLKQVSIPFRWGANGEVRVPPIYNLSAKTVYIVGWSIKNLSTAIATTAPVVVFKTANSEYTITGESVTVPINSIVTNIKVPLLSEEPIRSGKLLAQLTVTTTPGTAGPDGSASLELTIQGD